LWSTLIKIPILSNSGQRWNLEVPPDKDTYTRDRMMCSSRFINRNNVQSYQTKPLQKVTITSAAITEDPH